MMFGDSTTDNLLLKFCIMLFLFHAGSAYLEFKIIRNQLKPSLTYNGSLQCITKQVDQEGIRKQRHAASKDQSDEHDYQEVCYEKDISYAVQIVRDNRLLYISLDTTIPINWIKGNKCFISGSHKKCSYVQETLYTQVSKILQSRKTIANNSKYAVIEGSSQLVKGALETIQDFQFVIKDTSKMNNILELIMLGFYLRGEHQPLDLKETKFINAKQVSQNLNYLADGAISLRFDEMSERSLLMQLFQYPQANTLVTDSSPMKMVTIYLDEKKRRGQVAIGDLSTKFSKNGYGGIEWVAIQDDKYGKMPTISEIVIDSNDENSFSQLKDRKYSAVLSLSSSYIGLPQKVIYQLLKQFEDNKKSECAVNEKTNYLECRNAQLMQLSKRSITFVINDSISSVRLSFLLSDLVLPKHSSSDKTVLNLKQSLNNNYIILGEPVFLRFLVVFDYIKNRVGFSQKSMNPNYRIISVAALIRFICISFFVSCMAIICYKPAVTIVQKIRGENYYERLSREKNNKETRRLRPLPLRENPYDELSQEIRDAFDSSNESEHHKFTKF